MKRLAILLGLAACGSTDIGHLQSTSKIDVKSAPVVIVDDTVTPKSIERCVLYEESPAIKMKNGAPIGGDDLFWHPGTNKIVPVKRDVLRAMFSDPDGQCAAYYFFVLKVNGRTLYEVRAVEVGP